MDERVVVSACLLGRACRYDGGSRAHRGVAAAVEAVRARGGAVVAVCPEELGGLGTPRPAADLRGGDGHDVLDGTARVRRVHDDGDVTDRFVAGAREALRIAGPVTGAILKARSPSCGCRRVTIDGGSTDGQGVFAALLTRRGVRVVNEDEVDRGP